MTATGQSKPIVQWRRTSLLAIILISAILAVTPFTGFGGRKVCASCGKRFRYNQLHLGPFGWPKVTTLHEEADSGLSTFLRTNGIAIHCQHAWRFAAGGDYGILLPARSCALGRGQELWRAIDSQEAVAFLETLHQEHKTNEFKVWLTRLLNPDASYETLWAIGISERQGGNTDSRLQSAEQEFKEYREFKEDRDFRNPRWR